MDRSEMADNTNEKTEENNNEPAGIQGGKGQGADNAPEGGSSPPESGPQGPLQFTDAAVAAFLEALQGEEDDDKGLRVQVLGRGCGGLIYDLNIDITRDNDETHTEKGVTYLVDPISRAYLDGATIDYVDGDAGQGFIFSNPNDTPPTCNTGGCGGYCST